ncbi:MAG: DUF3187 family protein [Desulfuromonadales bacterium]
MNRCPVLLFLVLWSAGVAAAADLEIAPFRTVNQSPLVRIHGLPAETSATIQPVGHTSLSLTQDVANNFVVDGDASEAVRLDGESYRWVLALRHGFRDGIEAGAEIPWLTQGGGFLDGFVESYHRMIGYSDERSLLTKDRLAYRYSRDGQRKLSMTQAGSGIGDISLFAGMRLYDTNSEGHHDRFALRANLKLPTGSSTSLFGNGGADVAMLLCGSTEFSTGYGTVGAFSSAGVLGLTDSHVLRNNSNNVVGYGTAGIGWSPNSLISFKVQFNWNTPFYRNSHLNELTESAMMLVSGGSIRLPGDYLLDIGVSEDVAVATAPDVAIHLGLSKRF